MLGFLLSCGQQSAPVDSTDDTKTPTDPNSCVDIDGDKYGRGCDKGGDCDDHDPSRATECGAPYAGGPCTDGDTEPCYALSKIEDTTLQCESGTRTCVDGSWGICNMDKHYTLPRPGAFSGAITGPVSCNPCNPTCNISTDYPVGTDLNASNSSDVTYDSGSGGIILDGSGGGGGGGLTDTDGDGVPDAYEPGACVSDPGCDGFTENGDIFHVLAVGDPAVYDPLDISTQVRYADVYFLMDTTASMQDEIDNLKASLTTGTYVTNPTLCGLNGGTLSDWSGDYYENDTFSGSPSLSRTDSYIDFNWDWPNPGLFYLDGTDFDESLMSARWSATLDISSTASYVFNYTIPDDVGNWDTDTARLVIDGVEVVPSTVTSGTYTHAFTVGSHTIVFEYTEGGGDWTDTFVRLDLYPDSVPAAYEGLMGAISCDIADAAFGVGYFDDYPLAPHGDGSGSCDDGATGTTHDVPYFNLQNIIYNDRPAVQSAVDKLVAKCGDDYPESQSPALWSVASGLGLPYTESYSTTADEYLYQVDLSQTPTTLSVPSGSSSFALPAPPAAPSNVDIRSSGNNTIATAYSLGDVSSTRHLLTGKNSSGFSNDYTDSCGGSNKDAVVSFSVSTTTPLVISTSGTTAFDTTLSIRDGATTEIACNDDIDGSDLDSKIEFTAIPGHTYYAIVDGYGTGNFKLNVAPLAEGEQQLRPYNIGNFDPSSDRITVTGTTTNFTSEYGHWTTAGYCDADINSQDVVIQFYLTSDASVIFDATASAFPPTINIMDAGWNDVDCDDASYLNVGLTAGTYYVVIDGNLNASQKRGNFSLEISSGIAGAGAPYDLGDITNAASSVTGELQDLSYNANIWCASGNSGKDAVFTFTVTEEKSYTWSTYGTDYDATVMIYDSGFNEIWSWTSAYAGSQGGEVGVDTITPGTYYVVLDSCVNHQTDPGTFQFTIGPSLGDNESNAYDLGDIGGTWTTYQTASYNWYYSDDYTGLDCYGNTGTGNDTVFKFTLSERSEVLITTNKSHMYTMLRLYQDSVDEGNLQTCAAAYSSSPNSTIHRELDPGTYYVLVEGVINSASVFNLGIGSWPSGYGYYTPPQTGCAAGEFGYPCFREGAIPIVVMFSDAKSHNGPALAEEYDVPAPGYSDTVSQLNAIGAKVISINSGDPPRYSCDQPCLASHSEYRCDIPACTSSHQECGSGSYCDQGGCSSYYACWSVCDSYGTTCGNTDVCDSYGPVECAQDYSESESVMRQLAYDTGSVNADGDPLVYHISEDGSGLSSIVVRAISELANYSRMNITLRVNDNLATAAVDETEFVTSIATVPTAESAARCGVTHATWYGGPNPTDGCLPGTNVQFSVGFENTTITAPGTYTFTIDLLGDGSYVLDTVNVTIVVPGASTGTYPATGTYWRNYDSSGQCHNTERPDWGDLSWTVSTPSNSAVRWEISTSETVAGLDTATPLVFTTPPETGPVDIGAALEADGQFDHLPYLQVKAVLKASSDQTVTPTLTGFELNYDCLSKE
ncbi:MAG: hypothetical protein IPJ88_04270 [Myxococcales bacterium]|nr:MAG: hypothetical protein IPJ88_04270 [Myxococcales bacterium]